MAIKEIEMFGAVCDNCGEYWRDEDTGYIAFMNKGDLRDSVDACQWQVTDDDKTYCPNCYEIDDEDNLIVKKIKTCRACGCTENDCSQCIEKTGKPCYWVEDDLCSACLPK